MKSKIVVFFFCFTFFAGCKNDPVSPSPSMSGTWDFTWTNDSYTYTSMMKLSENKGALLCTLYLTMFQDTTLVPLSGSISESHVVALEGEYPPGSLSYYTISGTANTTRDTFTGRYTSSDHSKKPPVESGYYSMTASKR